MTKRKISPFRFFYRLEHSIPSLHWVIVFAGVGTALFSYLLKFKFIPPPEGFHIEWELGSGLLLVVIGIGMPFVVRWQLKKVASVTFDVGTVAPPHKSPSTQLETSLVRTDEDLIDLAEFFERVYPHRYIAGIGSDERQDIYKRWRERCPGFAWLIVRRRASKSREILGFSIVLRLDQTTYVSYRNGESDPWTWDERALLNFDAPGTSFLYLQAFYCSPAGGRRSAKYLYSHLIDHLRYFCSDPVSLPPVIYSPARMLQSIENLQRLGFEHARTSRGGFGIWELDCRRISELSSSARETYRALCSDRLLG